MMKTVAIGMLVGLTLAAVAAEEPKPAQASTGEVRAGADVQKPACSQGMMPMVMIEPDKGTAKGTWSARDNGSAWRILLDDRASPDKVKVAVFCQHR